MSQSTRFLGRRLDAKPRRRVVRHPDANPVSILVLAVGLFRLHRVIGWSLSVQLLVAVLIVSVASVSRVNLLNAGSGSLRWSSRAMNARHRGGCTFEGVGAAAGCRDPERRPMKNEFMIATRRALYQLRNAQDLHERLRARADSRLKAAQERHAADVARAEMVEAQGWFELLGVPGVTIPTAAALLQVSDSTVSRWVARYNRGIEEEAAAAHGGAA